MKGKILIVDDKRDMISLLKRIITEESEHEVHGEEDPTAALQRIREEPFDLVITDLKMPKMDGIDLLRQIKAVDSNISVVIMTAYATIETAVEATQTGAYDYITKPFRRERILLTVDKVMKWRQVIHENIQLREALAEQTGFANLIGASAGMKEIFERVKQVAPTMGTVLITGPSGTGKELLARAIHQHSARSGNRLVTLNCTAIPENVLESELFGHVRGAFTGAWKDKKGLVEEAHEGTLFLDEIGDLSLVLQTKLLRLLQEGEYKPVGSTVTKKADLRFIAATHHNLRLDIVEKKFREDLYYRLNVINFELPPLRDRKGDIPLLAYHFLGKYNRINGKEVEEIEPAAMNALTALDFPGNVRELENIIERGVIYCRGKTLSLRDLSLDPGSESEFPSMSDEIARMSFKDAKEKMTELFHRRYIEALLRENNGNISRAAEKAGIQRQYLHRLMKETGVNSEEFKQR
ncbi:MAG: sigma-54 dependent transcriptional regulator [Desulfobacterales bacterium]|nr:sigma-54 dependent transcriptional regulator [Desulfobacterales bacterium]